MRTVWILAANSGKAKIFQAENIHKLMEIKNFEHADIHLKEEDLISDRAGRTINSAASLQHNYAPKTDQKTKERLHFSEELVLFLEESFQKGVFERLYLIAPPQFLGFLREALSPHLLKLIHGEITKDLTLLSADEIRSYLPEFL